MMKSDVRRWMMIVLTMALCVVVNSEVSAQGRDYIRSQIKKWGECKNVAITKTNGDVALYGRNGTAQSGCPSGLNQALRELNNDDELIDDVQLTEDGRWLILWGNNGIRWNDIPYSLESALRQYNRDNEVITSVTFNDSGDWIVITTKHIQASDSHAQEWIAEGMREFGGVLAACVTDDAIVVVYEKGYKFLGNVPADLKTALRETKLDVYRLKIAGTAWFFADRNGRFRYNM